jgi:hypothetical protein
MLNAKSERNTTGEMNKVTTFKGMLANFLYLPRILGKEIYLPNREPEQRMITNKYPVPLLTCYIKYKGIIGLKIFYLANRKLWGKLSSIKMSSFRHVA